MGAGVTKASGKSAALMAAALPLVALIPALGFFAYIFLVTFMTLSWVASRTTVAFNGAFGRSL